ALCAASTSSLTESSTKVTRATPENSAPRRLRDIQSRNTSDVARSRLITPVINIGRRIRLGYGAAQRICDFLHVLRHEACGGCRQHVFQYTFQGHRVGTGAVSHAKVAGVVPVVPVQAELVVTGLTVEVHAESGGSDAVALAGVALCLFDLTDDAGVHRRPPKTTAPGPQQAGCLIHADGG